MLLKLCDAIGLLEAWKEIHGANSDKKNKRYKKEFEERARAFFVDEKSKRMKKHG